MASLEKKSLPIPGRTISKGFAISRNPCASVPSKSVSLTESILRRQMDPTTITKNTVLRQATFLVRERKTNRDVGRIWRPSYLPYRVEKSPHPKWSLNYMAPCISNTIVESKNSLHQCTQLPYGTSKLNCECTGDHQDLESHAGHWRKHVLKDKAFTTNQGDFGGTDMNSRIASSLTTFMVG